MFNFLKKNTVEAVEAQQFHELVQNWSEETKFTPDILAVSRKELHLVFIPDETMTGKYMHSVIAPGGRMAQGFTKEKYLMLRKEHKNSHSQTVVFEPHTVRDQVGVLGSLMQNGMLSAYPVRGEVHLLTPEELINLDTYKENGVKFHRKRIPLVVPHQFVMETPDGGRYRTPTTSKEIDALMYIGNYDAHFEHWHMTDANRLLASVPLIQAKVPYYYNL